MRAVAYSEGKKEGAMGLSLPGPHSFFANIAQGC
jgi:hypothetical protein